MINSLGVLRDRQAVAFGNAGDAGQRSAQVALDVDGERLERRDVEGANARAGPGGVATDEAIDGRKKGGA